MAADFFKKIISTGWAVFLCLFCCSPIPVTMWELFADGRLQHTWQTGNSDRTAQCDPFTSLVLENGKVTITSPTGRWESPSSWTVQQVMCSDLNHDHLPEVTLLVSRPFAPWPVDKVLPVGGRILKNQDAAGISSHIILIGWKRDHWGELWAGSALARPVRGFIIADMDGDGDQELVAREGMYSDIDPSTAATLAVWQWNGFGFDLVSRVEQHSSQFIHIQSDKENNSLILVQ